MHAKLSRKKKMLICLSAGYRKSFHKRNPNSHAPHDMKIEWRSSAWPIHEGIR